MGGSELLVTALVFTFTSIILFFLWRYAHTNYYSHKTRCTASVMARICDHVKKYSTDDRNVTTVLYYPVLEYIVNGTIVRVNADFAVDPHKYPRGWEIRILYDPNQPNYFYSEEFLSLINPKVFLVLFVIATVIAAGLFAGYFIL